LIADLDVLTTGDEESEVDLAVVLMRGLVRHWLVVDLAINALLRPLRSDKSWGS